MRYNAKKRFDRTARGVALLLIFNSLAEPCLLLAQGPPVPGLRATPGTTTETTAPARLPVTSPAGNGAPVRPVEEIKMGGQLKFKNAPIDMLLEDYAEKTGRTLLLGPGLPKANITLQSQDVLTLDEYLKAEESVLNMHGIGLIMVGTQFVKVVPNKDIVKDEITISSQQFTTVSDATGGVKVVSVPLDETSDEIKTQIMHLKHMDAAEAAKAVEPLKHPYALVHVYEQINALMVTDTPANINRISRILEMIDQPVESRETPFIMEIKYAKASEIKTKLQELIAESQKEQQSRSQTVVQTRNTGSPGVTQTRTIPGVIRARTPTTPRTTNLPTQIQDIIEQAERGIIHGKVVMVADDRTNILIIITRPENMKFFERVIGVLDKPTDPDVLVRVIRLEFAEAKTIAEMLNQLIGASSGKDDTPRTRGDAEGDAGGEGGTPRETAASRTLNEYLARARQNNTDAKAVAGISKVGELSADNIKILSDERTNSLIIMASKSDMIAMEGIIDDMDMMLSQVLIEAVILEITLNDNVQTGIDWLQRSMVMYNNRSDGSRDPVGAFAGGAGGGKSVPQNVANLTTPAVGSGLSYYLTYFDLNLDAVVTMASSDSRTRILSSPIIVTHDNTEAKIDSSEERYFYKGQRYVGYGTDQGRYQADVERRKVGLKLTVTPHINDKKFVVMDIAQDVEQIGGVQTIDDTDWPIVQSRTFSASIAVQNRETIVLGGLVKNSQGRSASGVPILRDIPLLGALFRSRSTDEARTEIVVFITPYVLDTPEEMVTESRYRKQSLNVGSLWQRGWSDSKLAEGQRIPIDEPESLNIGIPEGLPAGVEEE